MDPVRITVSLLYILLSLTAVCKCQNEEFDTTTEGRAPTYEEQINPSVTQTVYGFLDFTTTIGNTVMVFSPQSSATTSEKPTQPITPVINEKPQEEPSNEEEIQPSPSKFTTVESSSDTKHSTTTSVEKKSETKDIFKNDNSTPLHNNTNVKKSAKATPKSLNSPISKAKPKLVPSIHKTEIATESNTQSQLISTKKFVEKKTTTKVEGSTKSPPKSKAKPHIGHSHYNTSSKGKITPKPKTTEKSTTKSSTTITSSSISTSSEESQNEEPRGTVVVASKVEVHEGPTMVQKIKKGDLEGITSGPSSPFVTLKSNSQTEETRLTTAPEGQLVLTSSGPAKSEGTTSEENSDTSLLATIEDKSTTVSDTTNEEPAIMSSSGVSGPEYDFLSRQPSEVVDETFRVIDLTSNSNKNVRSKTNNRVVTTPADIYEETQPLGLITSLSDSIVKDGVTTVFETNVLGTIISGKYAQVLQSNSHVKNQKKIRPSSASTARILKTVAPLSPKPGKIPNLEPTPTYGEEASSISIDPYTGEADQNIKASRKPTLNNPKNKYGSNKSKFKDDYHDDYGITSPGEDEISDTDYTLSNVQQSTSPASYQTKKSSTKKSNQNSRPHKFQNNRFSRPTTPELATVSVFGESSASVTPSYSTSGRRFQPSSRRSTKTAPTTEKSYSTAKRSYKSKSSTNTDNNEINPPLPPIINKMKLIRPNGRWQYKTSPKPRVTIRRQDDGIDNITVSPVPQFTPDIQLERTDQELSGSGLYPALQHEDNSIVHDVTPSLTAETLRVEISTPADFKDVYYEIATIKTPYSFQVGTVKNTRFITVTSVFEKSLVQATEPVQIKNEPLSENILATTHNAYDKEPPLDSSVATLPPISLASDAETPPLETITESFSTTQLMLKTHILPVVRGGSDTLKYTLVQSYHVTRLVTATKTLPPMEVYQFVPSKTLNEFNTRLDEAGSEVHLELEFGDNNEQDEEARPNVAKALLSELDLTNVGSDFDIADVDKNKLLEQHLRLKKAHKTSSTSTTPLPPPSLPESPTTPALTPDQLQQLAFLRLLNPNAALPNVISTSKPILKVETLYESHILPIFNGASTFFTTISRPTATSTKTEYEYMTTTLPMIQPSVFNPLLPQPSFQLATTPLVTQTMVTETDSKILKLTFGAKTSYTTLFSTKVVPTLLTTYLTNSIPVQATVNPFPGFFNPSPFGFNAGFPYVG